ncbi:MAG: hypothetical protein HKN23_03510 [Verrucomicrobiales bacterium]|nr:hypothetical protein [Verrucomicrobiales bacterium]
MATAAPIDIGERRELFVDRHIVEKISGDAELRLHQPVPREIVLEHDAPWEGSGSGYHSLFHDGEKYRLYYKAWQLDIVDEKIATSKNRFLCYAESDDGIKWTKPKLGLFEYDGSKDNNIVIAVGGDFGGLNPDGAHAAVFLDENPNCPPEARFKMLARSMKPKGLIVLKSADGIKWKPLVDKPVLTEGAFDSQNLAFWDPIEKEYRAYWRIFSNNRRAIRTASSPDLIQWNPHRDLAYTGGAPAEHLYTNQIKPYHRAPHILVGFPARYTERDVDAPSIKALPEWEHRQLRITAGERMGTGLSDSVFICGRDRINFERWPEAFLRPGPERPGQWKYGDNYLAWHLVETKSDLPGAPPELSLYASEGYWTGKSNQLRRYTMRLDGFVSASAKRSGGSVLTKPLKFSGNQLFVNVATSVSGSLRVGIEYADGVPVPGFGLDDCPEIFGDSVDRPVVWKGSPDLSALAGKSVRLKFELSDADLYSFQFRSEK